MRKQTFDEYEMPDMNSDYYMPREENAPSDAPLLSEEARPSETDITSYSDEFNENVDHNDAETAKKHLKVKDFFLKPVAAAIIGVGAVFASFDLDPLGLDIFAGGSLLNGFPTLGNLDPDWAGDYAWNDLGLPELYVRYTDKDGNGHYLVRGEVWDDTGLGPEEGISYDRDTNTLTMENFTGSVLDMNLMGNGFTIRLIGDNYLDGITIWGAMYAGSLKFVGDGKLTIVEGSEHGITMNAEMSQTCLMVDRGVTLDIYGAYGAIDIESTTMEKGIYLLDDSRLEGGTVYTSSWEEPDGEMQKMYFHTVMAEDESPATHIIINP
jgi:hypothetical protein